MQSEIGLNNFSKLIEKKNFDDLSLTIYYMSPFTATGYPWSAEDLISRREENKIVINGSRLEEHIDLLNQINNNVLTQVDHKSRINARFMCLKLREKVSYSVFPCGVKITAYLSMGLRSRGMIFFMIL
jgi:hypothetical protein